MTTEEKRWEYVEGAIDAAKRRGITNDEVRQAVLGPDNTTLPAKFGREKRIFGKVTVIVDPKDRVILYISHTKERDKYKADESPTGLRKVSGGSSNKRHLSFDELVDLALEQGFKMRQGGKHRVLYPADEDMPIVTVPNSPSDYRGVKNFRAQLIRSGLRIDDE